jgi:hypothetical protein
MTQYLPTRISLHTKMFRFLLFISCSCKRHDTYITLCPSETSEKRQKGLTLIKKLFGLLRLKLVSWDYVQMSAL